MDDDGAGAAAGHPADGRADGVPGPVAPVRADGPSFGAEGPRSDGGGLDALAVAGGAVLSPDYRDERGSCDGERADGGAAAGGVRGGGGGAGAPAAAGEDDRVAVRAAAGGGGRGRGGRTRRAGCGGRGVAAWVGCRFWVLGYRGK